MDSAGRGLKNRWFEPPPRSLKSTSKLENRAELWVPPATKANQSMGDPVFCAENQKCHNSSTDTLACSVNPRIPTS